MVKYVFTTTMKRHERAELCLKLFREMQDNQRVILQEKAMKKRFLAETRGANRLKVRKTPLYFIDIIEYKGTVCYWIIDQGGGMSYVFNSSPIDGAFAEFISVIDGPGTKTVVYSQHALDRYNERIHKGKYTSHRDMIKRLMVNNPTKADTIIDDENMSIVAL